MPASGWSHPFLHTQKHQGDKGQSFRLVIIQCRAVLRHWVLPEFFHLSRSDKAALKTRFQSLRARNNTVLKTCLQSLHAQNNAAL